MRYQSGRKTRLNIQLHSHSLDTNYCKRVGEHYTWIVDRERIVCRILIGATRVVMSLTFFPTTYHLTLIKSVRRRLFIFFCVVELKIFLHQLASSQKPFALVLAYLSQGNCFSKGEHEALLFSRARQASSILAEAKSGLYIMYPYNTYVQLKQLNRSETAEFHSISRYMYIKASAIKQPRIFCHRLGLDNCDT